METQLEVRSFDSELTPEEFEKIPRNPVYPILDNLRSAFNVGSIVRTADCILAEKISYCGYTAHPPHKKLEKTSLGALPYVPWDYFETTEEAVLAYKQRGIPVIALEITNRSDLIWDIDFPLPTALVLGNEALGVEQDVLKSVDQIVEIPMLGYKNSINVSVAFGIVAYEIQRQHWEKMAPQLHLRRGEKT